MYLRHRHGNLSLWHLPRAAITSDGNRVIDSRRSGKHLLVPEMKSASRGRDLFGREKLRHVRDCADTLLLGCPHMEFWSCGSGIRGGVKGGIIAGAQTGSTDGQRCWKFRKLGWCVCLCFFVFLCVYAWAHTLGDWAVCLCVSFSVCVCPTELLYRLERESTTIKN